MEYFYAFDIAAFLVAIVIIVQYNLKKNIPTRRSKAFYIILLFVTGAACFDTGSALAIKYIEILPLWFNYFLLVGFNLCMHGCIYAYIYYVMLMAKQKEHDLYRVEKYAVIIGCVIDFALVISSPWTGAVFSFSDDLVYHSGPGTYYSYAVSFICILTGVGYMIARRRELVFREKFVVIFFTVVLLESMIVQIIFPWLLITTFGSVMCILVAAFTLENPNYYEEQALGVRNRLAFQTVVERMISDDRQFTVLGLHVEGMNDLRELIGIKSVNVVLRDIANFLIDLGDSDNLFSISENQFAFILVNGDSEVEMYVRKIRRRFTETFGTSDENVRLSVIMSRFSYPKDIKSSEGAMDLFEYSLAKSSENGGELVLEATSRLLEEKKRTGQVLQVLQNALAEKRFSIYYQPIYSVSTDSFGSAEALLRLYDEELGFISPDEFIPIAEKKGLIINVGEYVLRETCRFMAENKLWTKGIEYIGINMSPLQCIQPDLSEKFIEIMDEYKLDYSRISLEVTEVADAVSGRIFRENMQALIKNGVRFALDGYGAGYSGLSTLVDHPFSIIKLDKSMLWSAMKNDNAMTVLRQTVRMMKQLGLELIAEGVETDEQAQVLAYYGCDFFQGFFYAKPQPGEAFVKLIDERRAKNKA